jgi:hypothetical protein
MRTLITYLFFLSVISFACGLLIKNEIEWLGTLSWALFLPYANMLVWDFTKERKNSTRQLVRGSAAVLSASFLIYSLNYGVSQKSIIYILAGALVLMQFGIIVYALFKSFGLWVAFGVIAIGVALIGWTFYKIQKIEISDPIAFIELPILKQIEPEMEKTRILEVFGAPVRVFDDYDDEVDYEVWEYENNVGRMQFYIRKKKTESAYCVIYPLEKSLDNIWSGIPFHPDIRDGVSKITLRSEDVFIKIKVGSDSQIKRLTFKYR